MTIINEGLYNIKKNTTLYHPLSNIGDAIIMNNITNLIIKSIPPSKALTSEPSISNFIKAKFLELKNGI